MNRILNRIKNYKYKISSKRKIIYPRGDRRMPKEQFTLQIPWDLIEKIENESNYTGINKAEVIRQILYLYFEYEQHEN